MCNLCSNEEYYLSNSSLCTKINPKEKTVQIYDLINYIEGQLPIDGIYVYQDLPVEFKIQKKGINDYLVVFGIYRKTEGQIKKVIIYDYNSVDSYMTFKETLESPNIESNILALFNEEVATTTLKGLMSADDKLKLDLINNLIPAEASATNKLADKNYVNESVSTATATFRGSFNVVTDLGLAYYATNEQVATALASNISVADNNDYVYIQYPVNEQYLSIRKVSRFKFNGTAWGFEYDLNNSGATVVAIDRWVDNEWIQDYSHLLPQCETYTFRDLPITPIRVHSSYSGALGGGTTYYLYFPVYDRSAVSGGFDDPTVITEVLYYHVFSQERGSSILTQNGLKYEGVEDSLPSWAIAQLTEGLPVATNSKKGLMSASDKEKISSVLVDNTTAKVSELQIGQTNSSNTINTRTWDGFAESDLMITGGEHITLDNSTTIGDTANSYLEVLGDIYVHVNNKTHSLNLLAMFDAGLLTYVRDDVQTVNPSESD